jgi:hypothetical protein
LILYACLRAVLRERRPSALCESSSPQSRFSLPLPHAPSTGDTTRRYAVGGDAEARLWHGDERLVLSSWSVSRSFFLLRAIQQAPIFARPRCAPLPERRQRLRRLPVLIRRGEWRDGGVQLDRGARRTSVVASACTHTHTHTHTHTRTPFGVVGPQHPAPPPQHAPTQPHALAGRRHRPPGQRAPRCGPRTRAPPRARCGAARSARRGGRSARVGVWRGSPASPAAAGPEPAGWLHRPGAQASASASYPAARGQGGHERRCCSRQWWLTAAAPDGLPRPRDWRRGQRWW